MQTIEVATTGPDGKATTSAAKRRKNGKRARLGRGWKGFGERGEETLQEQFTRIRSNARDRLRKRLQILVRKALLGGKRRGVDFANLKIVYELLLKDEAAELERKKAEAAAMKPAAVVVTQEQMAAYVRKLLGKEITL